MPRRFSTTLFALFGLVLPLVACGNPSSDTASDTAPSQEPAAEPAATPDPASATESGGYEQIDRGSGQTQQAQPAQPASTSVTRPLPPRQPVPRQTATRAVGAGVQGDVDMFYGALDRDGSWVPHPDYDYVWLPSRMGPGWRPYQEGRWIWTDEYGWYWESEEPFAWAVYHYGRWDYDPAYGWFWVPGDTWAPAWVTWRVGGGSVGWAPIAPDRPGFAGGVPRRYAPPVAESWVFVQTPYFAERDVAPHVLPISQIGPSLQAAPEMRTPRFERNRVVNYGAPPDEMRPYLRGPIETRQLVYVGDRDDMFDDARDRRVGIYRPMIVAGEGVRPPPRVAEIGQARRVVVLDYAGPGPGRLYDAPSVALLDVLDAQERQRLAEERLNAKQAAVDARIDALQRERAALIEERRRQAAKLEAKIVREKEQAKAERKRLREMARAEWEKRAAKIKLEMPAPSGATAIQSQPAAAPAPVPAAIAPGEPPPVAGEAPSRTPPLETGAIEDDGKAPGAPGTESTPETSAAEPARDSAPPLAEPAPAPLPSAAPAPPPAPAPQQADIPSPAEPAAQPQDDRGDGRPKLRQAPKDAVAPEGDAAPDGARQKRARPAEAANPDQAPPPVEPAPPPPAQAMQPPPTGETPPDATMTQPEAVMNERTDTPSKTPEAAPEVSPPSPPEAVEPPPVDEAAPQE